MTVNIFQAVFFNSTSSQMTLSQLRFCTIVADGKYLRHCKFSLARDSITHLFHPPMPVYYDSSVHLMGFIHFTVQAKQRCNCLLCCLFPCQCLQSLEQDESSLSASRTRDCSKTKQQGVSPKG